MEKTKTARTPNSLILRQISQALGTLNHFAVVDTRSFEGLRLKPGSTVALHSTAHNRFVVMNDHKMFLGQPSP